MSDQPGMTAARLAALFGTGRPAHQPRGRAVTSDLSIDEALLLHSVGWEPVELVCGASSASLPAQVFGWTTAGWNGPDAASGPFTAALRSAMQRLQADASSAGGHGIVGVDVEVAVHPHTAEVVLTGTAVRPSGGDGGRRAAWVSDLSARDFCLLDQAGWMPLGLAFGTAFAQVPYRKLGQVLAQAGQNVELANYTNALYEAREVGMGRLQESAQALGAAGVVAVSLIDRPLPFAHHVVGFTCWGTAVRLAGDTHKHLRPRVVVPLRDVGQAFDVRRGLAGRHDAD